MQPQSKPKSVSNGSENSYIPKLPSSEKKFLQHFQTINTPTKPIPNFTKSTVSNKKNFNTLIEGYANTLSIIDKIVDSPVKQSRISQVEAQQLQFVTSPLMLNLNPGIRERITNIKKFFQEDLQPFHSLEPPTNLLSYVQAISMIPTDTQNRNFDRYSHEKSKSRSKSKNKEDQTRRYEKKLINIPLSTPPKQQRPMQQAEVNTDPVETTSSRSPQKLKKIDLLLVEIMREKKRKGIVGDYFRAIQMKLGELLEYILEDEEEYLVYSSLTDKMKAVLKNLQKFKGKTIDGESKVNMLRIFFEEFHNLKKQREDGENLSEAAKSRTPQKKNKPSNDPSKGILNPPSSHNRSEISIREKSDKSFGYNKSSKVSGNNKNFLGVPSPLKSNKGGKKNYETMSVGGTNGKSFSNQNNQIKKGPKSTMMEEDEWMGSLG